MEQLIQLSISNPSSRDLQQYHRHADNPNVVACLKDCNNEQQFFGKYSLQKSNMYVVNYRDRMINGNAPTLTTIRLAYGDSALYDWLNTYIADLAIFFGHTKNADPFQIESIAQSIYQCYPYLKVTEIMLFFVLFKGGKLKDTSGKNTAKMYGTFDGAAIMEGLDRFMEYRSCEIDRRIQEEQSAKRAEWENIKTRIIAPMWDETRRLLEADAAEKKKKRDAEKQRIIDEHNREFMKMLESKQYIKQ